ncbi:MAG: putative universal stress protein [Syntrophaceae bacterium PtaU1.Bin231]|nr:MAG: putative universal stress protein [Syntrophaceae bacterium PtaU1.Bin231]
MLPFRKILHPTDFSAPSLVALEAAKELAAQFSAELSVVHVVSAVPLLPVMEGTSSFDVETYQAELIACSRQALDDLIRKHFPNGGGPDQIVRIAEKEGVDLIVLATHGQTGWRHLVFGSVAARVVRLAPCPVLTVRAPYIDRP